MVVSAALALGASRPLTAQNTSNPSDSTNPFRPHPDLFTRGLTATAELGGRTWLRDLDTRQMGKLTEYKDLPSGAVLHSLFIGYTPDDSVKRYEFAAARIGQLDQTMGARAYAPGRFDFRIRWDRIPHTYSTTARMAGAEIAPGILTLPSPRPDTAAWNQSPFLGAIRSRWDPVRTSLSVSPSRRWDTKAEYTRVTKVGERPMGMSFGSSPGNNSREILEPLDQTMHDVRLTQSFATSDVQMVFSYDLSIFRNGLQSVTSDNPAATADSPTAGASRGRSALAPDNVAHTFMFAGGANLPLRTRVTASGSYSTWRQDQAFIPVTINSAINTSNVANVSSMPTSLGGKAGSSTVAFSANSRPVDRLTVTTRLRRYEFRDEADAHALPLMIINDRSIAAADTAHRDPFSRDNADVTARYRVFRPISVNASYAWERVDLASEERNTEQYLEHTPSVGVDLTGNKWMSLRTRWSKAQRRNAGYSFATNYLDSFRRLDLADRDRERITLIADVTPLDAVELSGTWKIGHDEYLNSAYGVQSDRSAMIGGDVAWYPDERFTIGAGWTREDFRDRFRGRYRTSAIPNNTTFDWVANNNDVVTTSSMNMTAELIPDRLEVGATYEESRTRFLMLASNPTPPSSPGATASTIASATAYDYPEISQKMRPFNGYVRYRLSSEWAATVRFQTEMFYQNDFRNLNLAAAPGTGTHIFLGNTFQNYNARYLTLSLTWRPTRLHVARSTI
jgi:MtrB/PioB family decaheme-associated outer membrane protein